MKIGSRLRHYRGGKYEVVGLARHSETLEDMVVYRSMETGIVWVRPYHMFSDEVAPGVTRFVDLDEPREWIMYNPALTPMDTIMYCPTCPTCWEPTYSEERCPFCDQMLKDPEEEMASHIANLAIDI